MDVLYHLESRNQLDGLYDTLAKVGLATGKVLPLLSAMSDREAQACEIYAAIQSLGSRSDIPQRIGHCFAATRLSPDYSSRLCGCCVTTS